ncbi:MAG: transposase, partial [Gammaproteobacteria bacterium]|nr:transposase [Gammaproteobacteria bacterium]
MVDSAALLVDEVLPHVPIRQWVLSVPFPIRFLFASQPSVMSAVLRIVVRAITGHLLSKAGYNRAQAQTGAVTLIQRFGSALNLNIHFHMLFLDGDYLCGPEFRFVPVAAPTRADLARLIEQISQRVARHLERQGWLDCDEDNSYLAWDAEQGSTLDDVIGHAVTYRIAVGPHCGQKAFTLQTLPASPPGEEEDRNVARNGGFSLHAGIAARADQRAKLERLCRYVARPAVATRRLSLTRQGDIRYSLKTPYCD